MRECLLGSKNFTIEEEKELKLIEDKLEYNKEDVSILHGCLVTLATCALGLVGSYHVLLPNGGLCTSRLFVMKIKSC